MNLISRVAKCAAFCAEIRKTSRAESTMIPLAIEQNMTPKTYFAFFAGLAFCLISPRARAEVTLGSPFSDNMVLQRDKSVVVWGKAGEGEKIAVDFRGETFLTEAKDGKWTVTFRPGKEGGPFEMTVQGKNEIQIHDILVGEVWLASGQSNMSYLVDTRNVPAEQLAAAKAMAAKNNPSIRFFMVKTRSIDEPQDDAVGQWVVAAPDNVGRCSAVAWYFAVRLHEKLKVPIGLLVPAVGGTPVEMWIPKPAFDATSVAAAIRARHTERLAHTTPEMVNKFKADLAAWNTANNTPELRAKNAKTRPRDPYTVATAPMPSRFYNTMVHGLEPYPMRGIIWFQADGNAGHPEEYGEMIKALITSWRANFHAELPFYYVEMNNMWEAQTKPVNTERNMGLIREAQEAALQLPKTGVVAAIDLCVAHDNPHFPNKQPVGDRLANLALAEVYGLPMGQVNSPAFAGYTVQGNKVRLRLKYADGLRARGDGAVKGFAIRGAKGDWVWAEGKIEGNEIVVWNNAIPEPVAVRYAWATFPVISVENNAGLPLRPFRTDKESPK
jgi:sialate O-acetylesterase